MNMKKKMTTLLMNYEALETTILRIKNEGKNKYSSIEEKVDQEIETMKLFKDRVSIEVDILKKQYEKGLNLNDENLKTQKSLKILQAKERKKEKSEIQ